LRGTYERFCRGLARQSLAAALSFAKLSKYSRIFDGGSPGCKQIFVPAAARERRLDDLLA
jgi:hypothetical protein